MHTRSKSPTEAQTAERAKSVAEIIGDIESYNEKKRQKEKEDERLVAERLLKLMELSEVPDAKSKSVAKQTPSVVDTALSAVDTVKVVAEHETVEEEQTTHDVVQDSVESVKDEVVQGSVESVQDTVVKGGVEFVQDTVVQGSVDSVQDEIVAVIEETNKEETVVQPMSEPITQCDQVESNEIQEQKTEEAVPVSVVQPEDQPIPQISESITHEDTEESEKEIQEQKIEEPPTTVETELVPEPWETAPQEDSHEEPAEGPAAVSSDDVALGPEPNPSLVEVIMKLDSIMNNLSA